MSGVEVLGLTAERCIELLDRRHVKKLAAFEMSGKQGFDLLTNGCVTLANPV